MACLTTSQCFNPRCPTCRDCARVRRCARCRFATYCSSQCQRDHWQGGHGRLCLPGSTYVEQAKRLRRFVRQVKRQKQATYKELSALVPAGGNERLVLVRLEIDGSLLCAHIPTPELALPGLKFLRDTLADYEAPPSLGRTALTVVMASMLTDPPERQVATAVLTLFGPAQDVPGPPGLLPLCCATCGREEAGLRTCGSCHARLYCSRRCQVVHWRAGHRRVCQSAVMLQAAQLGTPQSYLQQRRNPAQDCLWALRVTLQQAVLEVVCDATSLRQGAAPDDTELGESAKSALANWRAARQVWKSQKLGNKALQAELKAWVPAGLLPLFSGRNETRKSQGV